MRDIGVGVIGTGFMGKAHCFAYRAVAGIFPGSLRPVLQSVAESPTYLEQKSAPINHKVFLDALEYAKPKPTFRGYDEWATVVGDTLTTVWTGGEGWLPMLVCGCWELV